MNRVLVTLALLSLTLSACSDEAVDPNTEATGVLRVNVLPTFGDDGVIVPTTQYVTAAGETVTFTRIRFYVSEFGLMDIDDNMTMVEGIRLIDLFEPQGSAISGFDIELEPKHYHMMNFSIGVPESENHKDAATQSEPLGPNTGMYWGWDPGYIFYKIEGTVDSAGTPVTFLYHGGEDARKKSISLMGHNRMNVSAGDTTSVTIEVDMAKFFDQNLAQVGLLELAEDPSLRFHHKGPANVADMTARNFATTFGIAGMN